MKFVSDTDLSLYHVLKPSNGQNEYVTVCFWENYSDCVLHDLNKNCITSNRCEVGKVDIIEYLVKLVCEYGYEGKTEQARVFAE